MSEGVRPGGPLALLRRDELRRGDDATSESFALSYQGGVGAGLRPARL